MTSAATGGGVGVELKLPLLGDVMTEGTLAAWLQADGASVQKGDPLYQLETDKVTYTVDAPSAGVLRRLVAEGDTVPVGTVVGRLLDAASATAQAGEEAEATDGEVRASPAARRLAAELGVDLALLSPGRRIREADVQAYHDTHLKSVPPVVLRQAQDERGARDSASTPTGAPLTGRRKVIAERMRGSLASTAQLTIAMEVDVTEALRFREQLTQLLPDEHQPGITDLVMRAAVLALRDHPGLNATFQDGQLTLHPAIHLGLAVDAPEGLLVPLVRDAGDLPLPVLAERTKDLARRARTNQLAPSDLQGGTFTVTTLGGLDVAFFTPILNPPQVAILGVGRAFPKLALVNGAVAERTAMYLSLSFDHQVVDGAPAARFLQAVKRQLELPAGLLL